MKGVLLELEENGQAGAAGRDDDGGDEGQPGDRGPLEVKNSWTAGSWTTWQGRAGTYLGQDRRRP